MRYFHLNKNKYHCPVINLDKVSAGRWNIPCFGRRLFAAAARTHLMVWQAAAVAAAYAAPAAAKAGTLRHSSCCCAAEGHATSAGVRSCRPAGGGDGSAAAALLGLPPGLHGLPLSPPDSSSSTRSPAYTPSDLAAVRGACFGPAACWAQVSRPTIVLPTQTIPMPTRSQVWALVGEDARVAAAKDTAAAPVIDITKHGAPRSRLALAPFAALRWTACIASFTVFLLPSRLAHHARQLDCIHVFCSCLLACKLAPHCSLPVNFFRCTIPLIRRLLQAAGQGPAAAAAGGGARQVCEQAGGEEDQGGGFLEGAETFD